MLILMIELYIPVITDLDHYLCVSGNKLRLILGLRDLWYITGILIQLKLWNIIKTALVMYDMNLNDIL